MLIWTVIFMTLNFTAFSTAKFSSKMVGHIFRISLSTIEVSTGSTHNDK